jgi:hypothetical protein
MLLQDRLHSKALALTSFAKDRGSFASLASFPTRQAVLLLTTYRAAWRLTEPTSGALVGPGDLRPI